MTTEPRVLPRIHRLPPLLADQIAAGEVVERPASVVKELVENAIDAGATRITIEIARGGIELIRVVDDGHGIHPDDLRLALDRHATSKLRTADDLAAIRSLGFRGEALPSIASVARLRLASRVAADSMGRELETAPGTAADVRPVAHPVGTTVEVSALFHGVPARRRFLRSEQTETLHVLDVARRLSLSCNDIRLQVMTDGRRVLDVPGGDGRRRLREVIGAALERGAIPMTSHACGMTLTGWLCDPSAHRSQTDHQYFFLNGRIVRDRQLGHAVRMAHADHIPSGRHAAWVLHLGIDAAAADVNVHPTKHEVRFRHARDVHDFIVASVRESLHQAPRADVAESPGAWRARDAAPSQAAAPPAWRARSAVSAPPLPPPGLLIEGRYLAVERDGALWLADALEVCRRGLVARLASARSNGEVPRRPLLVPLQVPVTTDQASRLGARTGDLATWGWSLSQAGATGINLEEFPLALSDWPLAPLVRALAAATWADAAALPGAVAGQLTGDLPRELGAALLHGLARELGDDCPWREVDAAGMARLFRESGADD